MALITKIAPVGIDVSIQKLQTLLFNNLSWSGSTNGYQAYGRAYKNEDNGSKIPEVYDGSAEYKEVFTDDSFSASSFFLAADSRDVSENRVSTNVDVIFQLNLAETYPAITHRADEEAHKDVYNILKNNPWSFDVTNIVTGIDNVYSDLRITQVQTDNMQPFHVFKLTMNINDEMGCN